MSSRSPFGDKVREAYLESAEYFAKLVDGVDIDAWEDHALGQWTLRDLAGHTYRSISTVVGYSEKPAAQVDVESTTQWILNTKTESAARLLWLLCEVLEEDTVPPTSIIPTWRGGVTAEWHVNGFDLEIESYPSGTMEYNFVGPGNVEYEGPVDDNLENLRSHVKLLPEERH